MLVERKAFEGFSGASGGQRTVLGLVRMESGNKCLSTGPQFVHLILNVRVMYKRKLNNKTFFNQKLNSSIDSNFWLLLIHSKQLFVFVTHNFLRQNFFVRMYSFHQSSFVSQRLGQKSQSNLQKLSGIVVRIYNLQAFVMESLGSRLFLSRKLLSQRRF